MDKVEGEVLFLQSKITEVLGGSGYNTERLATPYVPQYTGKELQLCTACAGMSKRVQKCCKPSGLQLCLGFN